MQTSRSITERTKIIKTNAIVLTLIQTVKSLIITVYRVKKKPAFLNLESHVISHFLTSYIAQLFYIQCSWRLSLDSQS